MSAADQTEDEAAGLIQGWIDQELDQRGQAELERWLAAAPEPRRRFLIATHLHQRLGQLAPVQAIARPRGRQVRRLRRRSARSLAITLAVAALVMAGVGAWLVAHGHAPASGGPAADQLPREAVTPRVPSQWSVASAIACTRIRAGLRSSLPSGPLSAGDAVETGVDGAAELRMQDGTVLRIGAHARCEIPATAGAQAGNIPNQPEMILARGTLACEGAKQRPDAPLCLATQNARIRVIGTHLLIACDGVESTVTVTRGSVAVTAIGASEGVVLDAGQSGLVTTSPELAAARSVLVRPIGEPWGRLVRVGPGEAVATLAQVPALSPGDVVEIAAGTYHEARRWTESGTVLRPIVIRAATGAAVVIDGTGLDLSGVGAVSRALFQVEGAHVRVEGVTFTHARNRQNAAGIRLLAATASPSSDAASPIAMTASRARGTASASRIAASPPAARPSTTACATTATSTEDPAWRSWAAS